MKTVTKVALDHAYEELEEMDPSTFEAKAGSGQDFTPAMCVATTTTNARDGMTNEGVQVANAS
jgi:hypothetical protein